MNITPSEAKTVMKAALDARNLRYSRLSAKTVSFSDLGRGSRVFVKVHDWQPQTGWAELEAVARIYGFSIE